MGHPSPVVLPYARWWRTGSLSLFLLAVPLIALALAMGSVEGSITGDQPPASGDWVVRNPTTVSNETITLYGDIVVEANLTIADSILRLMPTSDGALTINVTSGGRLVVTDTLITSGNDHAFGFLVTGEMVLDRVTVKRPYLGIRVITNDDVLIANTTVLDPVDTAILLEGADGTVLRNVHVRAPRAGEDRRRGSHHRRARPLRQRERPDGHPDGEEGELRRAGNPLSLVHARGGHQGGTGPP
jgi:hypothetical protein